MSVRIADEFVGHFFHTFTPTGDLGWQGQVIGRVDPNDAYFLVRLFGWITGEETCRKVVALGTMTTWDFYETIQEMRDEATRRHEPV